MRGYLKALLRLGTFKYDRRMSENKNVISDEAVGAAKEAMCEVTPLPGVSKADWLAEYGEFALIVGAIAAAAPFIAAQALEDAADVFDELRMDRDASRIVPGTWEYFELFPIQHIRDRAEQIRGEQ